MTQITENTVTISHSLDLKKELSNDILEIAKQQGEDSDVTCMLLQEFKDMIFEQGDCTPPRMDDDFLIKFLRARYWKVNNAYKLLCRYTDFREKNPQLHQSISHSVIKNVIDENIMYVTPYTDQSGRRMLVFNIGNWNPSKVSIDDIFRATMQVMELGAMEPRSQICGAVGIFDLEGLSLGQAWYFTPTMAQRTIDLMVTCMPLRVSAIHILNQGWTFDAIFQMIKPFLNQKMREKVFIHGSDYSSLQKHIDVNHLSERYGGNVPDSDGHLWIDYLTRNEFIKKELESIGYTWPLEEKS